MFKESRTLRKQLFWIYVYKNCDNSGYRRQKKVGFARFARETISDDVRAVVMVVKTRTNRWHSFKSWVACYGGHTVFELVENKPHLGCFSDRYHA